MLAHQYLYFPSKPDFPGLQHTIKNMRIRMRIHTFLPFAVHNCLTLFMSSNSILWASALTHLKGLGANPVFLSVFLVLAIYQHENIETFKFLNL